ncbi:hypothetical protein PT277_00080 [Acetobacteraceae bacterium ESL0709]|nr:hypothetical protein [Acetobacteraceae bacterium ESL0697]MDF7677119.1 hypothetical protein [Acetobacteraceae bacterium ESL0709]
MLLSEKIAIIPIGISCIHAFQLRRARVDLEKYFACQFQETSSFFRWVYQDPRFISDIFKHNVSLNNDINMDDLFLNTDRKGHYAIPYLRKTKTWFMHDGINDYDNINKDEINYSLLKVCEKYNYLLSKMRGLYELEKRIFLFGNSDLGPRGWYLYRSGLVEWSFRKEDLERICHSINSIYTNGENIFVFVTNKINAINNLDCCRMYIMDDFSGFFDNNQKWDEIFFNLNNISRNKIINLNKNNDEFIKFINSGRVYTVRSKEINIDNNKVFRNNDMFNIDCDNGIVIWGPYITLSSGFYEAEIYFDKDTLYGDATFEVTASHGDICIIASKIDSDRINSDGTVKVRFVVGEYYHYVETRLAVNGPFKASLGRISIKKMT